MVILAIVIFISGLIVLWVSSNQAKKEGLPNGKLIYADTNLWHKVTTPLTDLKLGLTGKPDYIIKQGNQFIPVEVKKGNENSKPTESHIYQLAAYCFLIQTIYNQRPHYGIIHYESANLGQQKNQCNTFIINYNNDLEKSLMNIIRRMRSLENCTQVPRSHHSPARCKHCGYDQICDQKL